MLFIEKVKAIYKRYTIPLRAMSMLLVALTLIMVSGFKPVLAAWGDLGELCINEDATACTDYVNYTTTCLCNEGTCSMEFPDLRCVDCSDPGDQCCNENSGNDYYCGGGLLCEDPDNGGVCMSQEDAEENCDEADEYCCDGGDSPDYCVTDKTPNLTCDGYTCVIPEVDELCDEPDEDCCTGDVCNTDKYADLQCSEDTGTCRIIGEMQLCGQAGQDCCLPDVDHEDPWCLNSDIECITPNPDSYVSICWDPEDPAINCGWEGTECCDPGVIENDPDGDGCRINTLMCVGGFCEGGDSGFIEQDYFISFPYEGPIIDNLPALLSPIFKLLFYVGIFIGILGIIYSGYLLMVSEGDPGKAKEGKEQFTAAILGSLFILLSVVILRAIIDSILGVSSGL